MYIDFPPLETNRLHLRALTSDDLDFVFRHFSDPEVNRYLLDDESITTLEQANEIIDFYSQPAGKPYNRWAIIRKSDARTIGTCGYHKWQKRHNRAEIGYDLQPAARNQGFMAEALTVVLQFGFEQMDLNRIEALIYPSNLASIRLLEKLQFQKEGLLRSYFRHGKLYYDHWMYSLLKAQWSRALL
jgi:ribosomal-protein-alanine N-acetyltransferase